MLEGSSKLHPLCCHFTLVTITKSEEQARTLKNLNSCLHGQAPHGQKPFVLLRKDACMNEAMMEVAGSKFSILSLFKPSDSITLE